MLSNQFGSAEQPDNFLVQKVHLLKLPGNRWRICNSAQTRTVSQFWRKHAQQRANTKKARNEGSSPTWSCRPVIHGLFRNNIRTWKLSVLVSLCVNVSLCYCVTLFGFFCVIGYSVTLLMCQCVCFFSVLVYYCVLALVCLCISASDTALSASSGEWHGYFEYTHWNTGSGAQMTDFLNLQVWDTGRHSMVVDNLFLLCFLPLPSYFSTDLKWLFGVLVC